MTPRAIVVAASTPDEGERNWAAENLEGVRIYCDYEEMLEKEDLQAVIIASVTSVHAEQAIKAIAKGYHVLCEKPLSINVDIVGPSLDLLNTDTVMLTTSISLTRPNLSWTPITNRSRSIPIKKPCVVSHVGLTHLTVKFMRG